MLPSSRSVCPPRPFYITMDFATTDIAHHATDIPLVSTRIKQYVNLCSHILKQYYDTIKNLIRLRAYVLIFHLLLKADGFRVECTDCESNVVPEGRCAGGEGCTKRESEHLQKRNL